MLIISFPDGNDVVFGVPLDDKKFKIRFCWNHEGQFWALHLWDENDDVVLANIRVVPNFPLLMNHHVGDAPRGELIVLTKAEKLTRQCFQDGSATLIYTTEKEFYGR